MPSRVKFVPSPTSPYALSPQQYAAPVDAIRPHVWMPPALTCEKTIPPETATGVDLIGEGPVAEVPAEIHPPAVRGARGGDARRRTIRPALARRVGAAVDRIGDRRVGRRPVADLPARVVPPAVQRAGRGQAARRAVADGQRRERVRADDRDRQRAMAEIRRAVTRRAGEVVPPALRDAARRTSAQLSDPPAAICE